MGVVAALAGGALLGLGAAALSKKSKMPDFSGAQADFSDAVASVPRAPDAPISPDAGRKSDAMLAAEEEERKKRAAEAEANKTNHTGGLGVTGAASIGRKTLLG